MSNRVLGIVAMLCAPRLLIGGLLVQGGEDGLITSITGMVFMAGWICANTAMRRMQVTGTSKWGRAVLLIQLIQRIALLLTHPHRRCTILAQKSSWASVNAPMA